MKLKDLETLPPEVVSKLDSIRVQEYARATGWRVEPRLGAGKSAIYERPESRLQQISVPLHKDLPDFPFVMAKAIAVMAQFENRPATQLLVELLLPPSDLLKFSESGPATASGDLPFDRGLALLAGARKTLLAAACTAIRPQSFHPRMSLADAEQFIQRCRLGQTERGSFVMTVACPLDAVPTEPDLFLEPFTRRVTSYLMRSLHRLAHNLDRGDSEANLSQNGDEPILNANLCEGLLDMTPEGEESSLNISAVFSRTLPDASGVPTVVRLRREVFQRIEGLANRLRPTHEPRRELFVGFVETLNGRPNANNRPEGQVVLKIIAPNGETLCARAELNEHQYGDADRAHMANIPFTLEGVLRQAGRVFHVDQVSDFRILDRSSSNGIEPIQ